MCSLFKEQFILSKETIQNASLCPHINRSEAYSFWPVCLSVSWSAKTFNIGHIFSLVRVMAFVFRMSVPCDKTFLLVPSSRSSVKVKVEYEGHRFFFLGGGGNGCCGGISVSQTHLVSELRLFVDFDFSSSIKYPPRQV